MTLSAQVRLEPRAVIAPVDRGLFGSFVEHMGRCVYGGLFEPGHPSADEDGLRGDVLELVRELGVSLVRYPGGNFASGYRWEDGVGPLAQRPARLDLAWHSRESNTFGLDEFMRWTRKAGVEPMMTLNLGTRGIREALELLEYANHPGGSELSDRRIAHGAREPYRIRRWCLGNELDGPWQQGHKTAAEYARVAAEAARAMRQYDPGLRLIACGSSGASMPTFGEWERLVLEETVELIDEISLHAYYEEGDDLAGFLASGVDMDRSIERVAAIIDDVGRRSGSEQRIDIAVDEWNVWYLSRHLGRFHPVDWPEAPALCEDAYTVADAIVVGGLLISLLRHADRVTSACLAQLVNTIAPIKTVPGGPAWREATFYPFALTAAHARGQVLQLPVTAPQMETSRYGSVPVIDVAATLDDDGSVSLFVVNRHPSESVTLDVGAGDGARWHVGTAVVMNDVDVHAVNTPDDPLRVRPRDLGAITVEGPDVQAVLPPVSWSFIRLRHGWPAGPTRSLASA